MPTYKIAATQVEKIVIKLDPQLKETELLDYNHPSIVELFQEKGWNQLPKLEAAKEIYNYVQNDILLGYNKTDLLKASEVLEDGYGQCNTKGNLLMALFPRLYRFHSQRVWRRLLSKDGFLLIFC